MAKKRQGDFHQTQKFKKPKAGRSVSKGGNITNTKFNTKRIVTPTQKVKTSGVSLNDLIRSAGIKTVNEKMNALKEIRKYIKMNDSLLPSYFTEILNLTGKLFLELHPKVREEALNIIQTSADFLSDQQMSSFMNVLTSHLNCMMTHQNLGVKKDSLDLLSSLLKSHPNLICHSTKLLINLLNMISSMKGQKNDSFNQRKRKLDDNISTTMTSGKWREKVLKLIAEFLETLVDHYVRRKLPCDDEQKVYYDGENPLSIQLYAGGGLTPATLEATSDAVRSKSKVAEELKSFFCDFVSVASDIVTEELAGSNQSSDKSTLRPENIEHLSTITQVLCCIADWHSKVSEIEDEKFFLLMHSILRKKLMKGFCYKTQDFIFKKVSRRSKEVSCVDLNLGIASLYSIFILGTEFENVVLDMRILFLLVDVLNHPHCHNVKTVCQVLKIIRCILKMSNCIGEEITKYEETFSATFQHLCEMAGRSGDRDLTKEIHSFFTELSLDYDYKFLLDCGIFDSWCNYSFHQVKRMYCDKKPDKALLKCINLMCSREYPSFVAALQSSNPSEIVSFLKLDDEDYQMTVINLITHMTDLPIDFLQTVADLILTDQQLSLNIISKLIRSLYIKFVDKRVGIEELNEFFKFILNVSLDIISVEKAMEKYNSEYFQGNSEEENSEEQKEEYSEELMHHLLFVFNTWPYTIVPSQQWERHSKIFEVCLECLVIPQDRELTMNATTQFFTEFLSAKWTFPVHSIIALLKLATYVYLFEEYHLPHKQVTMICEELLCSSLYYISIVTHKGPQEKFKALGVIELQNIVSFNSTVYNFPQILANKLYDQGTMDEATLLHTVRIIKFLIIKNKISSSEVMDFQDIFQTIQMYCAEDSQQRAVLAQIFELLREEHHA